jgi:DNA replication protein DnaC
MKTLEVIIIIIKNKLKKEKNMNNESTIQKMQEMKFYGMARAFRSSMDTGTLPDFTADEMLAHLIDAEWDDRYNRKLERLLRSAKFRYHASFEQIDFTKSRNINKNTILRFSDCSWIKKGESIIVTGATGVGKSFMTCALGHQACLNGYRTMYFNSLKLFSNLKYAKADGTYIKTIEKIKKQDLIIIDDFGLDLLDEQKRLTLLEIIEDRHGTKSTIIASQLPPKKWFEVIGDPTIADAICDRLIHNSHKIILKGESMRKLKSKSNC